MDLNLCRLCFEEEATINIFESDEIPSLPVKIKLCSGGTLDVELNDGLPSRICTGCLLELNNCYRFMQVCKAADKTMRTLMNESNHTSYMETNESEFEQVSVSPESSKIIVNEDLQSAELGYGVNGCSNKNITAHIDQVRPPIRSMFTTNEEFNKLMCTVCCKEFQLWTKLAIHLAKHTNNIYHCLFCDKMWSTRNRVEDHILRRHFEEVNKYICEICGFVTSVKAYLPTHMEKHNTKSLYVCSICSKSFKTKNTLYSHKRVHSKKTHLCTLCGKGFPRRHYLKIHNIVHQDAKPFACELCPSRYKHKTNLVTHMKVHLQPGDYICHHCDAAYTNKFDLFRHIRSNHS